MKREGLRLDIRKTLLHDLNLRRKKKTLVPIPGLLSSSPGGFWELH